MEEEEPVPNRDLLFFYAFVSLLSVGCDCWLVLYAGGGGEVAIMSLVLSTYVADISTTCFFMSAKYSCRNQ